MKLYYLYRHIRPDKNEVFYVGVGTGDLSTKYQSSMYKRAYSKSDRNTYWHNIVNLNPDYEIEIMLESNNYDFVLEKEKEFIKLYGRADLGLGTLCNLTDGGEKNDNRIISDNQKKKLSMAGKGRKQSKEWVAKRMINRVGLKMDREWVEKRNSKRLENALNRGYYVSIDKRLSQAKSLYQYDVEGNFIKEWQMISDAAKELSLCKGNIIKVCKGKAKTCGNFIWRYKDGFNKHLEV